MGTKRARPWRRMWERSERCEKDRKDAVPMDMISRMPSIW